MRLEELLACDCALKEILFGMSDVIKARCVIKKYCSGSAVIKKDDTVKYVYILVKGELRVINEFENGSIYIFASNFPICFVGELEALSGEVRYAITLEAVTDCTVICITVEDFIKWMETDHTALMGVARGLAKKMYPTSSENGIVLFRSGVVKLQLYIVKHSKEKIKDTELLAINKNRQEIADEIGMSVKTVNRCVKKLKEEGLITIRKGKIYINKGQYSKLLDEIKDK